MRLASEAARAPGGPLWVDEVESGLGFAALRSEWEALFRASAAGPFLSWDWLYPWWRRLAPGTTPRILVAREGDGRLAGVLPLYESPLARAGVTVARWGFLGDSEVGSDYMEPLAERGREKELAALFVRHLETRLHRIDLLELLDLERGGAFGELLLERLAPGALVAEREPRFVCPTIPIEGDYGAYLKAVGRADNLGRRRRWLEAQPGYAIERAERPGEVAAPLADFFRLHRLRWERDGGSQGIYGPALHGFHRDAAALLAENGRLRLYTLRLGGKPLASVYGIVLRDRFYYYQSGYDPEWARRSVGLVLLGETIADAFRERRALFDFLRGSEPYKFEWAKGRRETEAVRIVNRTVGGLAWNAMRAARTETKAAARKMLGERAWKGLGWVRRRVRREAGGWRLEA